MTSINCLYHSLWTCIEVDNLDEKLKLAVKSIDVRFSDIRRKIFSIQKRISTFSDKKKLNKRPHTLLKDNEIRIIDIAKINFFSRKEIIKISKETIGHYAVTQKSRSALSKALSSYTTLEERALSEQLSEGKSFTFLESLRKNVKSIDKVMADRINTTLGKIFDIDDVFNSAIQELMQKKLLLKQSEVPEKQPSIQTSMIQASKQVSTMSISNKRPREKEIEQPFTKKPRTVENKPPLPNPTHYYFNPQEPQQDGNREFGEGPYPGDGLQTYNTVSPRANSYSQLPSSNNYNTESYATNSLSNQAAERVPLSSESAIHHAEQEAQSNLWGNNLWDQCADNEDLAYL